ncbi:hypothetical protein [Aeromicrobium piscarium]|uniref:Uncharacterized protein n=1 Tax=Aeromicrobium piscarium TaxID=2590901 RepID=A0A554S8K8_9ACTN|nr:hypothetical protein [Aeromicrobium piscarium]TSD62691.1 hypothetical protein FNM00_09900 [Aeromicrobium piscarium]
MTTVIVVALSLWLIIEVVSVISAGLGAPHAPSRMRLAVVAAEAVMVVVVTRALVPWNHLTQWIWVVAVAGATVGVALAVVRWSQLPAVQPGVSTTRTAASAIQLVVLAGIGLLVASTFR